MLDEIGEKQEYVEKLSSTLGTPGWTDIIKPALANLLHGSLNALVYGGAKDKNDQPIPDTEIRARIKIVNWVLEWDQKLAAAVDELVAMKAQAEPPKEEEPAGSVHDPRVVGLGIS